MADILDPELVRVPGGAFRMGAIDGHENERPIHTVSIDPFRIAPRPVTNAEYGRFVRATGYLAPRLRQVPLIVRPDQAEEFIFLASRLAWTDDAPPAGTEDCPVALASFDDARAYCRWLAAKTGRRYRLPTEAEWEKAARGGLDSARFPWGEELDETRAAYLASGRTRRTFGPQPVGTSPPNGYGLHDMAGNVWEWVSDWYRADYYAVGEAANPRGPANGTMRLVRGGSWTNENGAHLRCACRMPVPPDTYCYSIGFRVACSEAARP